MGRLTQATIDRCNDLYEALKIKPYSTVMISKRYNCTYSAARMLITEASFLFPIYEESDASAGTVYRAWSK